LCTFVEGKSGHATISLLIGALNVLDVAVGRRELLFQLYSLGLAGQRGRGGRRGGIGGEIEREEGGERVASAALVEPTAY
jgi:hypothetical protein